MIWKLPVLALACLLMAACQGSTPEVVQQSPTPSVATAIQRTATATTSLSTATAAATRVPTPTQTPTPTATPRLLPSPSPTRTPTALPKGPAVVVGNVSFGAEIANTPALRSRGLSGRPSLPPRTGMLFIFKSGVASNFWMNEMLVSLDFVWIGADCTVVDVTENVPHPETATSSLPLFHSARPAAFTFEINAGEVEALGLAIGDDVRFNGIDVEGAHC